MNDRMAVSEIVHLYANAMAFADEAALRRAFHPKASVIGNYQDALEWLTLDEFITAILAEPPATPGAKPRCDIGTIDITGDAASVRVGDDFAGLRFTDYLSLVKVDGAWQIVSRVYHLHV